jgi:hypothetical protein
LKPSQVSSRSLGVAIAALAAALSLPPLRSLIEQGMAWHMAVQMPLLVIAGALAARPRQPQGQPCTERWDAYGLTRFMAAQAILVYWMLPVSVDRAVVLPWVDAAKIVSLIGAGALLGTALARSTTVVQMFFTGYAASMLVTAGMTLALSDNRLCNAYSLDSQLRAGAATAAWGVALAVAWLLAASRCDRGWRLSHERTKS